MAFCFNEIGEILAGREHPDGVVPLSRIGGGHPFFREGIFAPQNDGVSAKFDAHGLEKFISRRLGNDWTRRVSNACLFGKVSGRTLYYVDSPKRNFFSMHRGKVSVIFGSNDVEVPEGWDGLAVLLSELFYLDDRNNIVVADDICRRLLPPDRRRRTAGANEPVRHERRTEWLQYLLALLAPLLKDPNAKISRPGFGEAKEFFLKTFSGMPTNTRTYRRDIDDMTGSEKSVSKYDKKDELVSRTWRHLTDAAYIREARIIEAITDELGKISADRGDEPRYGSIGCGAWQKVRGEERSELTPYVLP